MFSDNLKKWISEYVEESYTQDINEAIEIFEMALSMPEPDVKLKGVHETLPEVLETMSSAPSKKILAENMEKFVKIEPFLRFLLFNLYPERANRSPREETNGLDFGEWTLAPLLKQGLDCVPRDFNLSSGKPANMNFRYKEQYINVYNRRNNSAHDFEVMGQQMIFSTISDVLIVYLDTSMHVKQLIRKFSEKLVRNNEFSAESYCADIIKKYKEKQKSGFTYVDIKWKSQDSSDIQISSVDELMKQKTKTSIKILGEAGSGKTTIMQHLAYLDAKKYCAHESDVIPVFLALGELEKDPDASPKIENQIRLALNVSESVCLNMLKEGCISLYLDGFNEILDLKLKKQFAWSLDALMEDYSDMSIILSDRAILKSSVQALSNAEIYRLYPLDKNMIKIFIEGNCNDNAAKKLLLDQLNDNPEYFSNIKMPIQLYHLIMITKEKRQIPEDIEGEYIQYLFEREMVEKKDENVEYLSIFADALALLDKELIGMREAENCLAKVKTALGYTIPDTRVCLRLLIEMKILMLEEDQIRFASKEYANYFWADAFAQNLPDYFD